MNTASTESNTANHAVVSKVAGLARIDAVWPSATGSSARRAGPTSHTCRPRAAANMQPFSGLSRLAGPGAGGRGPKRAQRDQKATSA